MVSIENMSLCVVLTATIVVRNTNFTIRTDTATRLADYKDAFSKWLATPSVESLVLIENSGFDLSDFKDLASKFPDKQIELLSFECPPFDRGRGKGYGETLCLEYGWRHSQLIKRSTHFIKSTGRYYLKNIDSLVSDIERFPSADVICNMTKALTWADSRSFGGKIRFLEEYFFPLKESMDDSKHIYFEHVLARSIHRLMSEGGYWELPLELPDIDGISATINTSYQTNLLRKLQRRIKHRIKAYLIADHSYP